MERKLSNTERDFLQAKSNAERMSASLLKRFSWMKSFRWKGDATFHPGRRKESVEREAANGKETSFGLNMELTYLDLNNQEKTAEVIFRFKEKPFYDAAFKSYKKNPTTQDLIDQYKHTWIIFASGGTPEDPKAYIVAKLGDYRDLCFTPQTEHGRITKYRMSFARWAKWNSANQVDIFGHLSINERFEQIRR